ncbi:hypothetical protein Pint_11916 [Pistacia integerrima]|uniref:Uncharacterized protein n=1 Tax=Pistacia integerrima TaxID=434235 RepID=A0ACC0XJ73_9ROSI|nr:hypothetical protein Pint_11916 [Pistacia integerrima]
MNWMMKGSPPRHSSISFSIFRYCQFSGLDWFDLRREERLATWIGLGAGVPGIMIFMLSFWFLLQCMQRRYKEEKENRQALQLLCLGDEKNILQEKLQMENQDFSVFPLGQILDATRHFSEENKLGEGGFGPVYKVNHVVLVLARVGLYRFLE